MAAHMYRAEAPDGQSDARRQSFASTIIAVAILVLAVSLPRALVLDRFVTPDEHKWLTRSANFLLALSQHDYAHTYQREHPGVTTMWAGVAGLLWRFPGYTSVAEGPLEVGQYVQLVQNQNQKLLDLLAASRLMMVIGHTLALVLAFLVARRLIGSLPAFLGILFVAFDPFHVALSRVLHTDGLLGSLLLLSLLAFLSYLNERRLSDLALSGVAAGLSWLTKSPGFFLGPVIGLLGLIDFWWHLSARKDSRLIRLAWQSIWPPALWGAAGIVAFSLLWPALWVDPIGTLNKMITLAVGYTQTGHGNPLFFNGVVSSNGDVGASASLFYPITFLWRSTPVMLAGLMAAIIAFVFKREPLAQPAARRTVAGLVLFAVVFAAAMTLSAKKFDRYGLPIYPPLDLVAATGWVALGRWLAGRLTPRLQQATGPVILGLALVIQAVGTLNTSPYYFSYYNPLMGGGSQATNVMLIGWGEGLDQAARYLNNKPDAGELEVASWYIRPFSCIFTGISRRIPIQAELSEDELHRVLSADYVVIYIHQWQRQTPKNLLDVLVSQAPEHSIWINGLEYARIYKMSQDAAEPGDSTQNGL
jgi:hypothetical protein